MNISILICHEYFKKSDMLIKIALKTYTDLMFQAVL